MKNGGLGRKKETDDNTTDHIYIYIYIYLKTNIPVVGSSNCFEKVCVAVAILVNVSHQHRWHIHHKLCVIKKVDLNDSVAEAENDRVLCAQPLLHMCECSGALSGIRVLGSLIAN